MKKINRFKFMETTIENTNQLIGCRIDGAKTPFCNKLCLVHNCVREKGLDTCADCEQMDSRLIYLCTGLELRI